MKKILFVLLMLALGMSACIIIDEDSAPNSNLNSKGDDVVIVLDSSYVNSVNTITYGLRLDINNLDDSPIFVEASVPGKEWLVYTNATEIIVKNGFKYVKWKVICGNGTIRVGWYQYHMVNGLKVKHWATTSTSKYYKDGLPQFEVYKSGTYKSGTAPNN